MKLIKLSGTIQKNINSILDVINSLLKKIPTNKIPLTLEYVRVTEKFDVVRRSQGRQWVLTPDRK